MSEPIKEYKGYSLYKVKHGWQITGCNIISLFIAYFEESMFEEMIDKIFEANNLLGRNEY